jgi:serine/threonine protein kinase
MPPDADAAHAARERARTFCEGRYRLVDQVGGGAGWQAWKAVDVRLARPVTVQTFRRDFSRAGAAMAAARAASKVRDARLALVFDVVVDDGQVFVVTEWAGGDSLADLLAAGPLDPGQATEIVIQAAEALASAHASGVAHECLTPDCVRWTPGVGVKITGLGIDAALIGARTIDPVIADTQGLASLLYAALTARWPGDGWPFLPPAPEVGGYPLSPRQVRAGVPAGLAFLCCQALVPGRYARPPVTTPAALAAALNRTAAPADRHHLPPQAPAVTVGRRPAAARVMASIAAVLAAAAVGQGTWSWWHPQAVADANSAVSQFRWPAGATVLTPVAAAGFDPLSSPAEDPGNENTGEAHFAVDGNPATAWHTQYYLGNPRFGGLKSGTGLLLGMGRRVRVSSVTVTLGPVPGADLRVEVGNSDTRAPATLRGFTTVARHRNAGGTVTFTARAAAEGRFVLLWFTRLPPQAPGSTGLFQAEIFNVVVRGSR